MATGATLQLRDSVAQVIAESGLDARISASGVLIPTHNSEDVPENTVLCEVLLYDQRKSERLTTDDLEKMIPLDIVMQAQVANDTELEEMIGLAESIIDYLFQNPLLLDGHTALLTDEETVPIYDPKEYEDNRLFVGSSTLIFKVYG